MALVIYKAPNDERLSARMFSPRKITSTDAWFKNARLAIPQIPDTKNTDWQITETETHVTHIRYTLINSVGQRAYVTIDRTQPVLGR